jgi:hypothetical protein
MKKVVKLTESDMVDLIKKIVNEQSEPIVPLDTRLRFAKDKFVKFLQSSLSNLKPNDANEIPASIDQTLVNILKEAGDLLKMVRDSELQKQK